MGGGILLDPFSLIQGWDGGAGFIFPFPGWGDRHSNAGPLLPILGCGETVMLNIPTASPYLLRGWDGSGMVMMDAPLSALGVGW